MSSCGFGGVLSARRKAESRRAAVRSGLSVVSVCLGAFMGKCIFCPFEGRLTREHIWADWLRAYIPRVEQNYDVGNVTLYKPGTAPAEVKEKLVGGDPHSRRVKCVCKACNIGWMSTLQEAAKPIVVPLLTGEDIKLGRKEQRILAAWIAMAIMCSEFGDPTRVAISQDDRDILYRHHVPPRPNWRIWIGRYRRERWRSRWAHNLICVTKKEEEQRAFLENRFYNTQSTTYTVGELYIHAISCRIPRATREFRFQAPLDNALFEIWPTRGHTLAWPPPRVLNDSEALAISTSFLDAFRRLPI